MPAARAGSACGNPRRRRTRAPCAPPAQSAPQRLLGGAGDGPPLPPVSSPPAPLPSGPSVSSEEPWASRATTRARPQRAGTPRVTPGGGARDLRPRSGNTCLLSDYAGSGEGAGHGSAQGPSLLSQGDLAASGNPLAGRVPAGAGVRPLSATATVGSGAGRRVCRKPRRSPAPGPRGAAQSPVGPQWLPHDGGAGSLAVTTAGGLPAPPPTPAAPTHGGTGSHACRCRGSDPGSGRPWPRASLEGGTGGAAGPARPSPSTCGACCGCCSRGLGPYSPESGT